MKPRVFKILPVALILWFGLSGCQSCSCGKPEADGPDETVQQPRPGPGDLRVVVDNPGGPAEAGADAPPPNQRDNRAVDLSGAPLVEPVMPEKKPKAPPATIRATSVIKKLQDESNRRRGLEVSPTAPPPSSVRSPKRRGGRGKLRLSKEPPRGVTKARPGKGLTRGPGGEPLQ